MNLIRNDKVLFSKGFLYISCDIPGNLPSPPQEVYRDRKLSDMFDMTLRELGNMTLKELKVIKESI